MFKKRLFNYYFFILSLGASPLLNAQIKVACVGNSITYGYGLSSPSTQSYPSKLQNLLGNGYDVSNYGVSARTMLKKGDRPYWNETAFANAKKSSPNAVIIKLGTNDAKLQTNWLPHKAEFVPDYKSMIESFRSLPSNPEIYICQVVPAYKEIWEISDNTIKNEVNPAILQVAFETGVHLIDCYTHMSNKSSLFLSDGIHPNTSGASELADFIYQNIIYEIPDIIKQDTVLIAPEAFDYQWYLNNIPVKDSEGGKNKTLKITGPGKYKVSLKVSEVYETRLLTKEVSIILPNRLLQLETIDDTGFNNFDPETFEYNIELSPEKSEISFKVAPGENSVVYFEGDEMVSTEAGPVYLNEGESKTFTFTVVAPGYDTTRYEINVYREQQVSIKGMGQHEYLKISHGFVPGKIIIHNTSSFVGNLYFKLYDVSGKLVINKSFPGETNNSRLEVEMNNLQEGIFIYYLQQGTDKVCGKIYHHWFL